MKSFFSIEEKQESKSAGHISVAFDYQFFYFIRMAILLDTGETVGFEVQDDVHIERADNTVTLFQCKHTIQKNSKGEPINLSTLDLDLWKSLSDWAELINFNKRILQNYSFELITNKGEGNNKFIQALNIFKVDSDLDKICKTIQELHKHAENETIKSYIKKVLALNKNEKKAFFHKLKIETEIDDIIGDIKRILKKHYHKDSTVKAIFDSLISELVTKKYFEIYRGRKFKLSQEEFSKKFGLCFLPNWSMEKLPRRSIKISYPEDLEKQTFIRQIKDIDDTITEEQIYTWTTEMLQSSNEVWLWVNEHDILDPHFKNFEAEYYKIWDNAFSAKYRKLKEKLKSGSTIGELESEIKEIANELLYHIRCQNIPLRGEELGVGFTNGYYYSLADKPIIGWHFDWEKKYKES